MPAYNYHRGGHDQDFKREIEVNRPDFEIRQRHVDEQRNGLQNDQHSKCGIRAPTQASENAETEESCSHRVCNNGVIEAKAFLELKALLVR